MIEDHVCIFIIHDGERCKRPAYHSLESFEQTEGSNVSLVCFSLLILSDRCGRSSSASHGLLLEKNSVLIMFIPDRMSFLSKM